MKFGPVPVLEGEGAILAHTHRLGSGALKKGRRLSATDLKALAEEGHQTVVVARLEAEDVGEDEAAAQLAAACAGPGITAQPAKTGRANLMSAERGLLMVKAEQVDAVNLVDSALTLATLPPYSLVQPGDLVATTKIIPFSAPQAALDEAVSRAASPSPVLWVAPFRARPVALILTELPGVSAEQLARAAQSQRLRIEHLGAHVSLELRCPHHEAGVQDALRTAQASGAELILLLGASAIVDARDVLPEGLRRVGGTVEHVGMPMDPGNLLMLGRLGRCPVVGVPGCARSLSFNGFDVVLRRLLADLPLDRVDLMRMGAGGLLAEIGVRPTPRLPAPPAAVAKLGAVVLAAGQSRRMGEVNKLLAPWKGKALLAHVVDTLIDAGVSAVVVVTGFEAELVQASLSGRGVCFVHNPDYPEGMSTSLRAGLGQLDPSVQGALIALGDMPWVRVHHIRALMAAFRAKGPKSIWVPTFQRKRGNPVLWSAKHFAQMRRLSGDVGARALFETHADEVVEVAMTDGAVNLDVDTPEALSQLTGHDV